VKGRKFPSLVKEGARGWLACGLTDSRTRHPLTPPEQRRGAIFMAGGFPRGGGNEK
jgi:hypothetical protein